MLQLPLFFFNDTATTEIYTLSLHDALPISQGRGPQPSRQPPAQERHVPRRVRRPARRRVQGLLRPQTGGGQETQIGKSTRLNSSHANISYAVFCLKKKKEIM